MKTLQQVEPRIDLATVPSESGTQHKISQSGSYYLSDNLVVSNSIGISILASDVTLDLNGFKIMRAGNQAGSKGIYISAIRHIVIKNGSITDFEHGIYMYGSDGAYPTSGSRLEKLSISSCSGYGAFVGSESQIIDCSFDTNRGVAALFAAKNTLVKNTTAKNSSGGNGFYLFEGAKLFNCVAMDSGGNGFLLLEGANLFNCVAKNNGSAGFSSKSNSLFQACSATHNGGSGFYIENYSRIIDSAAYSNGWMGIAVGENCSLTRNTVTLNKADGIDAGYGSVITECTASKNKWIGIHTCYSVVSKCVANENTSDGFNIESGSSAVECISYENGSNGIVLNHGSTVSDCKAFNNAENGIKGVYIKNSIHDNNCTQNDSAGILVLGENSSITGNHLINNGIGIRVTSSDSWINCNVVTGNKTNWVVDSGNYCFVVSASASGAINGDSGGTALGSTDPNANFTY
jgi:hypothetical protein